jgi:hypothetical protein
MDSETKKIAIFDIEKLKENLELIKENCIEKTLLKYDVAFDDIMKICMAYNNIKESFNTLNVIQEELIKTLKEKT